MKLFFDLETTSLNCYSAEIITGYFIMRDNNNIVSTFDFTSRVNRWNEDVVAIHGISYNRMLSFLSKNDALDGLTRWLSSVSSSYDAVVYANPNTELGFLHYDIAVIQMELMNHLHVDNLFQQPFKPQNIISVHTLAKQAAKDGFFEPIKNENNRASFSQENVFKALFDDSYNAHDAKADCEAMLKIYDELNFRRDNNIVNRKQLELI